MVQRMQGRLGATIVFPMKKAASECTFCYTEMNAGQRVCQLSCWPDHQFHEECYTNFVNHFANQQLLCPICRAPIQQDQVIKKLLAAPTDMKTEDAFGLANNAKIQNADPVVNENEFARDSVAPVNDSNTLLAAQNLDVAPPGNGMVQAPAGQALDVPVEAPDAQGPARARTINLDEPAPIRAPGGDDGGPE